MQLTEKKLKSYGKCLRSGQKRFLLKRNCFNLELKFGKKIMVSIFVIIRSIYNMITNIPSIIFFAEVMFHF